MSQNKQSEAIVINNPQGLHMRPAYLFAETAAKFNSEIRVTKDELSIDGKSVISILTLGATQGSSVVVEADGPDADEAVEVLSSLLISGFPTDEEAAGN